MTAASLCIPFSQIQILEPSLVPLTSSVVTASTFNVSGTLLAVAYAAGTIILFDVIREKEKQQHDGVHPLKFRAYLNGHTTAIVSLACCTARTENGKDTEYLLSLSVDGNLRKWSLADGRCVQAADAVLDSRPRGLTVFSLPPSSTQDLLGWLTGEYILVYGCTTAITILSSATFEAVVLWTSNPDWPLPMCYTDATACRVLTCTAEGSIQGWSIEKDEGSGSLAISKSYGFKFLVGNETFGRVKAVHMLPGETLAFLVVQAKGLSTYRVSSSDAKGVKKIAEMEMKDGGISDASCSAGRIWVWTPSRDVFLYSQDLTELSTTKMSPPDGRRILNVAFGSDDSGDGIIAGFCQGPTGPGTTYFGMYGETDRKFNWSTNVETPALTKEDPRATIPPSTSCTSFSDLLVFACGESLLVHSLSSFLLDFSKPRRTVRLESSNIADSVTLLRHVTLTESPGTAESSSFLIVGMATGSVYVVDPISFEVSPCVHLHTHPIRAVLALPVDLAPRLRSTLLVCSEDGTSSILDVSSSSSKPKVRPMLCLPPAVSMSPIYAIATQAARNLVLLIHEDGGRRLWDVDTVEGGGILVGDTTHKNHHRDPSSRHELEAAVDFEDYDPATSAWREVRLVDDAASTEQVPEAISTCCPVPSCHGTPTALVNVRELANLLQSANRRRGSNSSYKPKPNTAARAVLKTLLSNAKRVLGDLTSLQSNGDQPLDDEEPGALPEMEETLASLLSKEVRRAAAIGVLGEHEHVSLLSAARDKASPHPYWLSASSHLRATATLCVVILLRAIWPAREGEKDKNWKTKKSLTRRLLEWTPPDRHELDSGLAVFASYWFDRQDTVREAARACMTETLNELSRDEVANRISYWREFLPVTVSPDIFGIKEVALSVVILGSIVAACDERAETKGLIDQVLRKNVSLSIEFLLGDRNTFHQDSAIGLIGHGWLSWQSHFDSFEVIHTLIRIHASTATDQQRQNLTSMTLLDIATKNAPLLVSGLANCISHSVTTETSSNSSLGEIAALSMAAMKAVGYIVRENPVIFAELELLKVIIEAIVKVLDPQAGILRDRVLSGVTGVVNELVSAYPTVAFHRPTQKLALSKSHPQAVSVFDLRSGTLNVSLEGHPRAVQFLTFSGDGKYIVGVDLQVSQLYVWRLGGGFLSSFMGAASINVLGDSVAGAGTGTLKGRHGFKNDRKVGLVKVEFSGEKTVRITAGSDVSNINI